MASAAFSFSRESRERPAGCVPGSGAREDQHDDGPGELQEHLLNDEGEAEGLLDPVQLDQGELPVRSSSPFGCKLLSPENGLRRGCG